MQPSPPGRTTRRRAVRPTAALSWSRCNVRPFNIVHAPAWTLTDIPHDAAHLGNYAPSVASRVRNCDANTARSGSDNGANTCASAVRISSSSCVACADRRTSATNGTLGGPSDRRRVARTGRRPTPAPAACPWFGQPPTVAPALAGPSTLVAQHEQHQVLLRSYLVLGQCALKRVTKQPRTKPRGPCRYSPHSCLRPRVG